MWNKMIATLPFMVRRRQATDWLAAHGEAAIPILSERIAAAVRAGDERTAVRLDHILAAVERAVDASPDRYAT